MRFYIIDGVIIPEAEVSEEQRVKYYNMTLCANDMVRTINIAKGRDSWAIPFNPQENLSDMHKLCQFILPEVQRHKPEAKYEIRDEREEYGYYSIMFYEHAMGSEYYEATAAKEKLNWDYVTNQHGRILYALRNIETAAAEHPDTFIIPSLEVRTSVQVGQCVKVHIDSNGGPVERVWVQVVKPITGGYECTLANDPISVPLSFGDTINIKYHHIASIE